MGIEKLISLATTLVFIAAATGQLPRITHQVQLAQLRLLKESQGSKWGSPDLLYSHRSGEKRHSL